MIKLIIAGLLTILTILPSGTTYTATSYCLRGKTFTGSKAGPGTAASDPRYLPLGTRIKVTSNRGTEIFTVRDTGGAIKGRTLDLWYPCREAKQFGRQKVQVIRL